MASGLTNLPSPPSESIETHRLTVRPFSAMLKASSTTASTLDDHYLQFFYRLRRQPHVMKWSLEGAVDSSLAQTESWVRGRVCRRWNFVVERKVDPAILGSPNPGLPHAVPVNKAGWAEPIGSVGIRIPSENAKSPDLQVEFPELGFMFDETFHGQGYATEAVLALLKTFWAATGEWDVVEAYIRPANAGSLRVVAKCGFEYWRQAGEDRVYRVDRPANNENKPED